MPEPIIHAPQLLTLGLICKPYELSDGEGSVFNRFSDGSTVSVSRRGGNVGWEVTDPAGAPLATWGKEPKQYSSFSQAVTELIVRGYGPLAPAPAWPLEGFALLKDVSWGAEHSTDSQISFKDGSAVLQCVTIRRELSGWYAMTRCGYFLGDWKSVWRFNNPTHAAYELGKLGHGPITAVKQIEEKRAALGQEIREENQRDFERENPTGPFGGSLPSVAVGVVESDAVNTITFRLEVTLPFKLEASNGVTKKPEATNAPGSP